MRDDNNVVLTSADDTAYYQFMGEHVDAFRLNNSSDCVDDMIQTLLAAGFITAEGEVVQTA